jgi:hypothetical protein
VTSCEGTFGIGAVAEAPPAIVKDTPATPSAGKDFRIRFRFEACFACAIAEISYICEENAQRMEPYPSHKSVC